MFRSFFDHSNALALLWLLLVLAVTAAFAERIRRRALRTWGSPSVAPPRHRFRLLSLALLLVGLGLLIAGIAGPRWGESESPETAAGRDIVCVLDVSRSMLAEDVFPNRLGRAKALLTELSWTIQKRGGHRLALVAFASRAEVVCPLTHDYDHFRAALEQIETIEPRPELRPTTEFPFGTRIGAGLVAAVQTQSESAPGFEDILLFSDGDDPARDNEWQSGVQAARSAGISIYVVGIGDRENGRPIPGPRGAPFRHDGQVILTRLEEKPLEAIAEGTGGSYFPARTNALTIGSWFEKQISTKISHAAGDDLLLLKLPRYHWFIGLALLFLSGTLILDQRQTMSEVTRI
jgi:Ca-activated chloride channel family protein